MQLHILLKLMRVFGCGLLTALIMQWTVGCEKSSGVSAAVSPPRALPMPTIGVCTSVDNADKLKAAGYDFIEGSVRRFLQPHESSKEFAKTLVIAKESSLPIYAFTGFLPGELKCVGPEASHDRVLEYARIVFDRAAQVNGKIIVFGSSGARRVPAGFDHGHATRQFIELLKRMGPIAQEYGIIVAVEPLNKRECNFLNSVNAGIEIVKAVDHPHIRLVADVYHMAMEDEGPESILKAGPLIAHVHIAEKEGRARPGVHGYDFVPYFAALNAIGYSGGISIEGRWDDFDQELAAALEYVKKQIKTAYVSIDY